MTDHEGRHSLKEWTELYQREQESQNEQISELTKIVHSLSADVRSLIDNQKGLFSRVNRPPPVGAYITAVVASLAVMISFATLVVRPLVDEVDDVRANHFLDVERNLSLHMMMKEDIEENREAAAVNKETLRWLEKLEERYNQRIHGTMGGVE